MFEALDTEVDKQLDAKLFANANNYAMLLSSPGEAFTRDVAGLKKLRERKLPNVEDTRTGGVNGLIKTHLIKSTETQSKLIECLDHALGACRPCVWLRVR